MELISVIIPTKNRIAFLKRAIDSVRQQEWKNIEIIVVDDNSNDGTDNYLASLNQEDNSVIVVSNDIPRGGALARNQGIALARGEYIAFIDDDDTWLPGKLAAQIAFLKANPDYVAVSCDFNILYDTKRVGRKIKKIPPFTDLQQLLQVNFLGGASMCMIRSSVLQSVHGFDAELPSCQDWDLWIKLALAGKIGVINEPYVNYYSHAEERISSKLNNVYKGRLKIYFQYRDRMTQETKKKNVAGIVFIRILMRADSTFSKIRRLFLTFKHVSFRMFLSYLRAVLVSVNKPKALI